MAAGRTQPRGSRPRSGWGPAGPLEPAARPLFHPAGERERGEKGGEPTARTPAQDQRNKVPLWDRQCGAIFKPPQGGQAGPAGHKTPSRANSASIRAGRLAIISVFARYPLRVPSKPLKPGEGETRSQMRATLSLAGVPDHVRRTVAGLGNCDRNAPASGQPPRVKGATRPA